MECLNEATEQNMAKQNKRTKQTSATLNNSTEQNIEGSLGAEQNI